MKIAEYAKRATGFFFDLTAAVCAIDRNDRARTRHGKRDLNLVGIVVIVRGVRSNSKLLADRVFKNSLIRVTHKISTQRDLRINGFRLAESPVLMIQCESRYAKKQSQCET